MKPWLILGAGGHAAVIADIILKNGEELLGFLDDRYPMDFEILGKEVIGKIAKCVEYSQCRFIIGIGDNNVRTKLSKMYQLCYGTAIHPSSIIGNQVEIGEGTAIMANSVINPCSKIGVHVIINTSAVVEHDNNIGDFVHISPRAALGGSVVVGKRTHVGIGATIKNNINICNDVMLGAGAAAVKDICEPGTYIGVPANIMKR